MLLHLIIVWFAMFFFVQAVQGFSSVVFVLKLRLYLFEPTKLLGLLSFIFRF